MNLTPQPWSVHVARIPEESEGIVRLTNTYDSEPESVERFNRLHDSWITTDPRLRLTVTDPSGRVVGTSFCRRRASMAPGVFFLTIFVDENATGQGIGRALLETSTGFAQSSGCTKLTAFVVERVPRARGFAEKNGFALSRHLFESVMPVDRVTEDEIDTAKHGAEQHGIVFKTLAEIGYNDRTAQMMYDITTECDLDEPGTQEFGGLSFEDYKRSVLEASWFSPEGVTIALSGDEWAGIHALGKLEGSEVADVTVDFTGVRRPFRGKGLARTLKLLGVRYARSIGGTKIMTHNDSLNAPMLAVNTRLGYEPRPGWMLMSKPLGQETAR